MSNLILVEPTAELQSLFKEVIDNVSDATVFGKDNNKITTVVFKEEKSIVFYVFSRSVNPVAKLRSGDSPLLLWRAMPNEHNNCYLTINDVINNLKELVKLL